MNRRNLAIFDLDGTLFDTKNVNFAAYREALIRSGYKQMLDYEYYCEFCNGASYKTFLPRIAPGISLADMNRIHEAKKALYSSFLHLAKMNDHLFAIINLIRVEYKIALVTAASAKNADDILNRFQVKKRFDFIIAQEDVKNTKPDPECFLLALKKAGTTAENSIIFEDSEVGFKAAELSGIRYVKICGFN